MKNILIGSVVAIASFISVLSLAGTTYKVGDIGPAGGYVFHVTPNGKHGMEGMDTIRNESGYLQIFEWGCYGVDTRSRGKTVGEGYTNTQELLSSGCKSIDGGLIAAKVADSFSIESSDKVVYDDWYLPSSDELLSLGKVLSQHGLLLSGYSKESDADCTWSSTNYENNRDSAEFAWQFLITQKDIRLPILGRFYSDWYFRSNKCAVKPVRNF